MTPLGRLAEAEEVAYAIGFLASPAAAMITGTTLTRWMVVFWRSEGSRWRGAAVLRNDPCVAFPSHE